MREKSRIWGVWTYYSTDYDQLPIEDFFLPFGGSLDPKNRWIRLSQIMPWDEIKEIYLRTMSVETGRRAYSSRISFGAVNIKDAEKLTDESSVTAIQENPYMQYFLGLHEFTQEPLFDASAYEIMFYECVRLFLAFGSVKSYIVSVKPEGGLN